MTRSCLVLAGTTGTGSALVTLQWCPPLGASTVFLLGLQNTTAGFAPRFLNLTDAPELGM